MTLPNKLTSIRLIAVFSCLLALGAYPAFLPASASGEIPMDVPVEGVEGCYCKYDGKDYSPGAVLNGKTCRVHNGECYWG